jgi:hypothetical protein
MRTLRWGLSILSVCLLSAASAAADLPQSGQQRGGPVDLVETLGLAELAVALFMAPAEGSAAESAESGSAELGRAAADQLLQALGWSGMLPAEVERLRRTDPIFLAATEATEATEARAADPSAATEAFEAQLFHAMAQGLTTGYNIFPRGTRLEVPVEHTIVYGHNRLKHLKQLLFLLRIEGLEPAFTIVPKTSAFMLREGWGVADAERPRLPDGTPVALLAEYDLVMKFASSADVSRFQELVTRYAKKDFEGEAGLIYRAWWQPFYRSRVATEGMRRTQEIWLSMDGFEANILSLPGDTTDKVAALSALSSDWAIDVVDLWVNPSFYRYLEGDFR